MRLEHLHLREDPEPTGPHAGALKLMDKLSDEILDDIKGRMEKLGLSDKMSYEPEFSQIVDKGFSFGVKKRVRPGDLFAKIDIWINDVSSEQYEDAFHEIWLAAGELADAYSVLGVETFLDPFEQVAVRHYAMELDIAITKGERQ